MPRTAHIATGNLVEAMLEGRTGVVLHDVVVHRALYEWAEAREVPQVLLARERKSRPDPAGWLLENAPAIGRILVLGAGEHGEGRGLEIVGVSPIQRPIGAGTLWGTRTAPRFAWPSFPSGAAARRMRNPSSMPPSPLRAAFPRPRASA